MDSGNPFDDEKTIIADLQSELGEEKLLFGLEADPENKRFLNSGEAVTVGRSTESDFFIENKTVSRKHLTITREGRVVNIKIHGRNGLYMDNELHMGPLLTLSPPVSFTIGDVLCGLEFEVDEEKTIIVTLEQRTGMINTVRPHDKPRTFPSPDPDPDPDPEPDPEPETRTSFDPSPRDTFIPSDDPIFNGGAAANRDGFSPPDQRGQEYTDSSERSYEQSPVMGQDSFEPVPKDKKSLLNEKQPFLKGLAANKNDVIIAGIIALSVLIIIFIFFLIFTGRPDKHVTPSDTPPQTLSKPASSTVYGGAPENSYKISYDNIKYLIDTGDMVTARDALNDIPKDSPYYSRAKKLLDEQTGN